MTNGTAPPRERTRGAKMTIRVYTVTAEGVITAPRATVKVTYGQTPPLEGMGTQLPPCACPLHRQAGAVR
ncbi:hypothetical protein [Streptomyces cylindrosporus]|uniref:Uncharacterized protein n=1 Tax=Streptomyces cylindrosporus TaxID=2927583 RepID=A0ABS9YJX6_9ACTN|nr:hypothetical protein [Streptomyces cylindrosporus]MCI3277551.1 hypothetical protein [Streptomyces cylindrosporus]